MLRNQESLQKLLNRLESVKKLKDGWIARCPAHDDRNPSLSVSEGTGGRVLVHCFAGCKYDSVLMALGLESRDLFVS